MNTLEDKLTAALRETSEQISPHSVPPLHLPGAPRRTRLPAVRGRRWAAGLTPLAAAVAVAAVVVVSLAVSAGIHSRLRGGPGPATSARVRGAPAGTQAALRDVPPYFVALSDPAQARSAAVRSTVTGRTLATLTPPRPYRIFTWVSAAADDRTFVLAAQRWWNVASGTAGLPAEERNGTAPTAFFRLTFNPATRTAQLAKLVIPGTIQSSQLAGMALSADGTRLALDLRQSIQVITLATGANRSWTWPGGGWIGNWKPNGQVLSWTADGRTLEFQQWGGKLDDTAHVRLLDTTAPGSSLASAKVILTFPTKPGPLDIGAMNTLLTPDGTRIVTATVQPGRGSRPTRQQITEYSARTGTVVASEDQFTTPAGPPGWQDVLWAGPGGQALVVSDPRGKPVAPYGPTNILGVLTGNRFTPIPGGTYQGVQLAW
jgi:hypothetical protein